MKMRWARLNPGTVPAGSTKTLSRALDSGKTIRLDTAAGSVVTLPPAIGDGTRFHFVVTLAPSSNSHIIKVANANDTIAGVLSVSPTTIAGAVTLNTAEAAGGTDDTISMNGTTGGGIVGSWLTLEDVKANLWAVRGQLVGSGTITTPFSATVS